MLMPEATPDADLIMVATGTGIAPYRGFLRRLFIEETPAAAAFKGLAWLVLGVPTSEGLLYDEDWQEIAARKPDNFRLTYAISREQSTAAGGKMYVQDRLAESAEELFERLDKGAHIYFCGLKGMSARAAHVTPDAHAAPASARPPGSCRYARPVIAPCAAVPPFFASPTTPTLPD